MKASVRVRRTSARSSREDGDTTKAKIIEAAGVLFSEYGIADVTSKEICEAAGVNITAVNYHFGSRDGLQRAVLKAMHDYMAGPDVLAESDAGDNARERLEQLLERLIIIIDDDKAWQVKLWAREILSPSETTIEALKNRNIPAMQIIPRLIAVAAGTDADDPRLGMYFMFVMSPYILALITRNNTYSPYRKGLEMGAEALAKELFKLIFGGLDAAMKTRPDTVLPHN